MKASDVAPDRTVVDAFGVYSDPALSALLEHVPIRQTA
jgi:hypothetical protein